MKKIRINVLARELEVKSHLILELLPELGVSEKLTHSSSIDEDVADKLRVRFGIEPVGSGDGQPAAEAAEEKAGPAVAVEEPPAKPAETELREPAREAPVAPAAQTKTEPAADQPAAEPAARPSPPVRPPIAA